MKMRQLLGALLGLGLSLTAQAATTYPVFGPATGVLKGSVSSPLTSAAAYTDIVGLWTSCTSPSTKVLKADGTCSTFSAVTPAALTKADDTNVTLTLGGTPTTALLQATSITAGWTGTLATGRGGTGVSSLGNLTKTDDTNVTMTLGGTPTGALITATSLTMGWTGTLAASRGGLGMSTVTDDTVAVANGSTWQSKALTDCDAATSAVTYDTTTNAWGCNSISGAVGANPSGTIGLAAVNGVATTFTRSDGTAALSQAIAPTWSALHTFSNATTSALNPTLFLSATTPSYALRETGAGSNAKVWDTVAFGGQLLYRTDDDTGAGAKNYLAVSRSGAAVTSVSLGNATDNPSYAFLGTGSVTGAAAAWSAASGSSTINSSTSTNAAIEFFNLGGVNKVRIGVEGTAGSTITGSSANDALIYSTTGVTFSTNSGGGTGRMASDGGFQWPAAVTGGSQGAGTINAAGLYINGVSVVGGATTTGSFSSTLTGYASGPSCTINYRITGTRVDLWVNTGAACTGTSNANTLTVPSLPTAIRPPHAVIVPTSVGDNGNSGLGCAVITAAGTSITLSINSVSGTLVYCGAAAFTTSGVKGLPAGWLITYDIGS